jgi:hypothetical protein
MPMHYSGEGLGFEKEENVGFPSRIHTWWVRSQSDRRMLHNQDGEAENKFRRLKTHDHIVVLIIEFSRPRVLAQERWGSTEEKRHLSMYQKMFFFEDENRCTLGEESFSNKRKLSHFNPKYFLRMWCNLVSSFRSPSRVLPLIGELSETWKDGSPDLEIFTYY